MQIEKGKPYHCAETSLGLGLTGKLLISESDLRVQIFSYSKPFHINTAVPLQLVAETGESVSLHSCIEGGGSYGRVKRQDVIANVAIVGPDPWTEADRINHVSFSVEHTKDIMRSRKHFDGIDQKEFAGTEFLHLFTDTASGIRVGAHYRGTWGPDFQSPNQVWPVFAIEFNEPKDIHSYLEYVIYYVDFFSFCLGVPLRPTNISIFRNSSEEMAKAAQRGAHSYPHEVHYNWPETKIESHRFWTGGSPVLANGDDELLAFRACLIAWMNRAADWRKAYAMMMSSFRFAEELSSERLLGACKWFEELPNAQSKNALSSEEVSAITAAAVLKAEELGKSDLGVRIKGSIARLKEETAEERFVRLVDLVKTKFGQEVLPDNAVSHLKSAFAFRGRSAHGHFTPKDDDEFHAFSQAIHALEALCLLLTAVDLPILQSGLERMEVYRPVENYRRQAKGNNKKLSLTAERPPP
jgi:hypothetical protein